MTGGYRATGPLFRFVFASGGILSFLAGIQLFVLADRTDDFFAWTIAVPASAAFFGAFYWSSVVIAAVSYPRREWARARVGLYGLVVFFWLTLAATLVHLDKFHLGAGETAARVSGWIWLVVYIVVPAFWVVAFAAQSRIVGSDPPVEAPMPAVYRGALLALGAALLVAGVVLLVAPGAAADIWPWPLTPLVSRAAGAWLVGAGIVLLTMWRERDFDRAVPGAAFCASLSVLLAIGLVRYPDDVEWGRGAVYVVALAVLLAIGGVGLLRARRPRVGSA
jgi:hypothetical protein